MSVKNDGIPMVKILKNNSQGLSSSESTSSDSGLKSGSGKANKEVVLTAVNNNQFESRRELSYCHRFVGQRLQITKS